MKGRIRDECEEEEERGDAHQESDQLVESPVPGGHKNGRQIIHEGRIRSPKIRLQRRDRARAITLCQEAGVLTIGEL